MNTTALVFTRQPLKDRPIHQWLSDTNLDIVLLTTHTALQGVSQEILRHYTDIAAVDDYQSWTTEVYAERLARQHHVSFVAASSEDDVLRAARVRQRLGLVGQSLTSALAYRDKYIMKAHLQEAGIPIPHFAKVDTPSDICDFIEAHGFPVVVKPRCSKGSIGIHVLTQQTDLIKLLQSPFLPVTPENSGYWMIETYIEGSFFHIDGIVCEGRVLHCWPSEYSTGNADHLYNLQPLTSVMLGHNDSRNLLLRSFAEQVHRALPHTPFPVSFHLEAWIDPEGTPLLCEVASRTGGSPIAHAYEKAFNVHLSKESFRGQCQLPLALTHQPEQPACYVGWLDLPRLHGMFSPPTDPCPVQGVELVYHIKAGTRCHGMRSLYEEAATALVIGDTAPQVRQRIEELVGWWQASDPWKSE